MITVFDLELIYHTAPTYLALFLVTLGLILDETVPVSLGNRVK